MQDRWSTIYCATQSSETFDEATERSLTDTLGPDVRGQFSAPLLVEPIGRRLIGSRGRPHAPARMCAVGGALAAWRAAERTLTELEPGSLEWEQANATIARFRDDYRWLVTDKGGPALAAS